MRLALCVFLGVFFSFKSNSQYADLGSGNLKNFIWWVDWSGFSMTNGATKNFITDDGLNVSIAFSNVSNPPLPNAMQTWNGAVLHNLYNFTNASIKPALYNNNTTLNAQFSMSITATRNGVPSSFLFVGADAEASITEVTTLQTTGTVWSMVDFFRNSSQTTNPLTGCGTNTVNIIQTYGGASGVGQNPVVSTNSTAGVPLVVNVTMNQLGVFGGMAVAFGIMSPVDRGDLPLSYTTAQHKLSFTNLNGCSFTSPLPGLSQVTSLKIGNTAGDADGIQTLDDNTLGTDEDALNTPFPNYLGSGAYSLTIPVTNNTGTDAYLTGYFDFNRNGSFNSGESVTVNVPNNATTATLTWTGLLNSLPVGSVSNFGFRFRLSSNLASTSVPGGLALDGEVEDYLVPINTVVNVVPTFVIPDTVCVNTPVNIVNTSVGASSYYWNFCLANINAIPVGANLGNINDQFSTPVFMDIVEDNGNYYGFVSNNFPGKLTRLDFGNSLLNSPVAVNLGNIGGIIPDAAEGIQVIKNEGKWYAIMVGGNNSTPASSSRIVRISFGSNITNINPIGTNWGNIGTLTYPSDLHIFNDNGSWYGFTLNANSNSITRFNFGASFENIPTGINLGNLGNLNFPTGIFAMNDNGNWHVFVCNQGSSTISRLDFGTSLLNTPLGVNLGNPNGILQQPRDIYLIKFCGQITGFVVNELSNDIVQLSLSTITSTPRASSLGNIANFSFPHSISKIYRVGADLYSFVTNVTNNTISRLKFSGCVNASIPNSTLQTPPPVSYNSAGVYNINLTIDEGLSTQSSFCKSIVVVAPPLHTPTANYVICANDSINLVAPVLNANYLWSNAATTATIKVKTAGIYWVNSTTYAGCTVKDSMIVTVKALPNINAGTDAFVCSLDSIALNAIGIGSFNWTPVTGLSNPNINNPKVSPLGNTDYVVTLTDVNGCSAKDTITINVLPKPQITKTANSSICKDSIFQINAFAVNAVSYSWTPTSGLNNSFIANPLASPISTTNYNVTVTGANGCSQKDSILVTVLPKPTIVVRGDTSVCNKTPLLVSSNSTNASTFSWQPVTGLSNPAIANPIATPTISTQYIVTASNGICAIKDTFNLGINPLPVIAKSIDTTICKTGTALLNVSGGVNYLWSPNYNLSSLNSNSVSAKPDTTTYYFVITTGANACAIKDSIKVTVNPKPLFGLQPLSATICRNDSVSLSATGGDVYQWIPTTNILSTSQAATKVYPTISTVYKVIITNNACKLSDTLSTSLNVNPLPVTTITKSNDIDCANINSRLNVSGGINYSWQPADGIIIFNTSNPIVSPSQTTTYLVKVTGTNGCSTYDSINVKVDYASTKALYLMPNAFTPNKDGLNDCFGLKYWGGITKLEFNIYNRFGQIVFQTNNPTDCWNGKFKGIDADFGTYIYQIKATTICGGDIYRKGTFVLLR